MNNVEFGGFDSLFGIEMPEQKSTKKKTNNAKKETKPKGSSSKKSKNKEDKYMMPIVLHTEWGDLTVGEDVEGKELTVSEISSKLDFPLKIVAKDGVFVGIFNNLKECKEKHIKGKLFTNGQLVDVDSDVEEYLTSDKMRMYEITKDVYVARYDKIASV